MATLNMDATITGEVIGAARTGAGTDQVLASPELAKAQSVKRWNELVINPLIDWGRDPSILEDEGLDAPSFEIVNIAHRLAIGMRDSDFAPPDRVIPNGDGGIVFKQKNDNTLISIEICKDRTTEVTIFRNGNLIFRHMA